jgi:membrane fusion protein (multidrug efflux system)
MKKNTKIVLIGLIVLFIVGMAIFPTVKDKLFGTSTIEEPVVADNNKSSKGGPLNINAMVMKYSTMNETFRTKGILVPDEEVNLSFEASGKIINIYFQEGTMVQKGALLAKINDKPLQAELEKLQAQIPLAEDRVFRQKSLLAKDAVSKEAYDQVTTDLDKLHADIKLAKARIAETELRAPFDGIIGLRQVSEGAYATPSTIIAKLTKIVPLKIEFSVNEKQASDIQAGLPLEFTLDNDLNKYKASVYAIESNLDLQTLALRVRAIYPNVGGKLKPGRSVSIDIKLKEIKNTLSVPSQAVIAEMGRDIAYIYKNGVAQQVQLTKGLRTASSVQIIKGLSVGDTLITTGVMQLRDGLPVSIDKIIENSDK